MEHGTPRTDAIVINGNTERFLRMCRQLERELAAAQAKVDKATSRITELESRELVRNNTDPQPVTKGSDAMSDSVTNALPDRCSHGILFPAYCAYCCNPSNYPIIDNPVTNALPPEPDWMEHRIGPHPSDYIDVVSASNYDALRTVAKKLQRENAEMRTALTEITQHSVCCDARHTASAALDARKEG